MESASRSKYLPVLIELGILKKETPITEKPGKKTVYRIEDYFFHFWYRFVPQNLPLISSGRFAGVYDRVVRAGTHDLMGLVFEKTRGEYRLKKRPGKADLSGDPVPASNGRQGKNS